MSFICGNCGKAQMPGTKEIKVPSKIRITGPGRVKTATERGPDGEKLVILSLGGGALQIAEEISLCPSCAQNPPKPEVVETIGPSAA